MQFYLVNVCQAMIFRPYIVCNKHDIIKIGNQTKKKKKIKRIIASARLILLPTVQYPPEVKPCHLYPGYTLEMSKTMKYTIFSLFSIYCD